MSALKLSITIYLYSPCSIPNNHSHRYNIVAGSSFAVSCSVGLPGQYFNIDFYIDNLTSPITGDTLPNITISKTSAKNYTISPATIFYVTLTFNNFQAAHNGRYICQANIYELYSTRIGHALYGTGAITVTPVTPRYQVYDTNEEIYVEVQIRGEFYDNSWVYHPTDPTGDSSGSTILMLNSDDASNPNGVSGEVFQQGLRISVNSSSHRAGYYIPVIQDTQFTSGVTMGNESTLYRMYASPSATLSTLGSQSFGSKLTVICTATGYPEVTISFTTTDISASNKTGDPITTVIATPIAPFTTMRSITFYSLTFSDCGSVTCTASNSDGTTTSTVTATPDVQVIGPPTVTISPLEEQVVGIGDSVTLTCSADDCVGSAFSFIWYRDGSYVSASGVLTISNVTSSDFGEYTCNVTGDGGTGSAATYISEAISESTTSIQLYLSPVSNCLTWTDANGDSKLSDISESVQSVTMNCPKCNISYRAEPFFSCLGTDSDQTVVFRAQIVYQYIRNSPTNPLSLLQSWVSSGPLLTVFRQQLRVNSACQVERSLNTTPQCTPPSTPLPPSSSTAIVATVCVIVVFSTIFLIAIIVIVLILCIGRWKRNRKAIPVKEEYEYMHTVQGGLPGGMVYSMVGEPTEMHKNPAYESAHGKEGDTEGEHVYEGNISYTTTKDDQPMEEESSHL